MEEKLDATHLIGLNRNRSGEGKELVLQIHIHLSSMAGSFSSAIHAGNHATRSKGGGRQHLAGLAADEEQ